MTSGFVNIPLPPGKRPTGRFKTPEAMEAAVERYFSSLPEDKRPTVSGLALSLGFSSTRGLLRCHNIEGFDDVVSRALLRIEVSLEEALEDKSAMGTIFALKNHFGWTDRHEVSHDIRMSDMSDEALRRELAELTAATGLPVPPAAPDGDGDG